MARGASTSATAGAAAATAAAGAELLTFGLVLPESVATGATLTLAGVTADSIDATSGGRGVLSTLSAACGRRDTGRGTEDTLPLLAAGDVAARAIAKPPPASPGIDGSTAGGELLLAESVAPGATETATGAAEPGAATLASG